MNFLNEFELHLLHVLHDVLNCELADSFFSLITKLADAGVFWIILAIVLLFFKKTRRAGVAMAFSLILGLLITNITIKPLVARIRPYVVDPSIVLIIPPESEFSFPSGHTSTSFECAFALFCYNKKAGAVALELATMIGISRLYLMVHYPTDVICGALFGVVIAIVAVKIANWVVDKTKMPAD